MPAITIEVRRRLPTLVNVRPIGNESDYDAALAEIDRLMGAGPGTPEAVELEALVSLVEAYEAERWPVGGPGRPEPEPTENTVTHVTGP